MNKYIYTNNNSDTSANIYFLNDKNIISEINDNVSGLNPIASYDLVKNLSSTANEAISKLNQDSLQYFKLSANNIITESNTFEKTQTFDKISVDTVYSDFSKIFNCQEGKLSDIINGIVDTDTVGNIHRTIADICLYANLTTYIADDIELDDMLVSSIKSIIDEKPDELLIHSNIVKFKNTDLNEIINTYTIKQYLEVLNTIVNSLNIDTHVYSLADRLKQIEKSIDALDEYLTQDINFIKTTINNISSGVSNITSSIDLSSNDKLSIITNIQQIAGKITVDGTELLSNHVKGLTSYAYETNRTLSSISSTISSLSNHISSTYAMCSDIPLSTSQLINNGRDNSGKFIGRDEIKLSSGYIGENYILQLLTKNDEYLLASLVANDFIQDSMLQSVELKYLNPDDHRSGVLEFTWNIHEGSADRSMQVPLSSLIDNLYKGKDGINVSDYEISPDYSVIAAVSSVNNLCSTVTLISNDINNMASYVGHITINSRQNSTSSIIDILGQSNLTHSTKLGYIRNGSIYEVNWHDINELSSPELNANAFITTSDGITLHHKDMIIVHFHDRNDQYINVNDISVNNIKILTAVNWPTFYSLCCAVSSDCVWLKGGNSLDNNHAISGNNDYLGEHRFENISASNSDLVSAGISNLTATNISASNSNLVSANISDLIATNISANQLSIDLNNLINTNSESIYKYPNVQQFITSVELSITNEMTTRINDDKYLSNTISSKIIIDGTPAISVELQHISQDDYHDLVLSKDGPLSNVLYIVSSDSLNMYDERIINLADPISATDGVTKQYVDNISTSLSDDYCNKDLELSGVLSSYINNISTSLSNDYCEKIEAKSNIYLSSINDSSITGGKLNQLNIVKFDALSTYELCCSEENPSLVVTLSDLVLIEEEQLNAENKTIINVGIPSADTDAANKQYIDGKFASISNIKEQISKSTNLSSIYDSVLNNNIESISTPSIISAIYELITILSGL